MRQEDSRSPLPPEQTRKEDVLRESPQDFPGARREPENGSPLPSDLPRHEDVMRPDSGQTGPDAGHDELREQRLPDGGEDA